MAEYRLQIKPSAAKEIDAIDTKRERQRIVRRIQGLAADPRSPGCEKLTGEFSRFRVRQGQYRVIYSVDDGRHVVEVVRVGHRREVSRDAN